MSRSCFSFGRYPELSGAWLLAAALFASPSSGQFHSLEAPHDSPLWWTLSDEVSAESLRDAHRNPRANLERYMKDLESGEGHLLSEERSKQLKFYINAEVTPELVPMWYAFDLFAVFRLPREGGESIARQLGRSGVSEAGRKTIMEVATDHRAALQATTARLGPLQVEFQRLQQKAAERLGASQDGVQAVAEASKRGDIEVLSRATGESQARIRVLLQASKRDPLSEVGESSLPLLKQKLSSDDWNALRRYLLVEIAAGIGIRANPHS